MPRIRSAPAACSLWSLTSGTACRWGSSNSVSSQNSLEMHNCCLCGGALVRVGCHVLPTMTSAQAGPAAQVLEAVRAAEAALGPIDLAVANAGVATMGEQRPEAPQ